MSDIEKIKSALLIAYIGDIGCTLILAATEKVRELEAESAALKHAVDDMQSTLAKVETENAALRETNRWRLTSELPEEGQWVEVINSTFEVFTWHFSKYILSTFQNRYTHWRPFTPPQEEE